MKKILILFSLLLPFGGSLAEAASNDKRVVMCTTPDQGHKAVDPWFTVHANVNGWLKKTGEKNGPAAIMDLAEVHSKRVPVVLRCFSAIRIRQPSYCE